LENKMAKRTKKVGSAGRYQARYGVKARMRIRDTEIQQRIKHKCPKCGQTKVKRSGTGIWTCKKCGNIFAGGAYIPKTAQGLDTDKILKGGIKNISE
jgi:large subunit ribosomal protein L37Ae